MNDYFAFFRPNAVVKHFFIYLTSVGFATILRSLYIAQGESKYSLEQ